MEGRSEEGKEGGRERGIKREQLEEGVEGEGRGSEKWRGREGEMDDHYTCTCTLFYFSLQCSAILKETTKQAVTYKQCT